MRDCGLDCGWGQVPLLPSQALFPPAIFIGDGDETFLFLPSFRTNLQKGDPGLGPGCAYHREGGGAD